MAIHTYDREGRRLTAASPEEMERLREVEAARKKYDPGYITHAEAMKIPEQLMSEDPGLASRVRASSEHWPESMAPASTIFTDLPGGAGEVVENCDIDTASLFTGRPMGDEGGSE